MLVVIITVATSALALCYELWPGLRPDPRVIVGAEMKAVAVEPLVSLEDWIRRTSEDEAEEQERRRKYLNDGLTDREQRRVLRERGTVVYMRVTVEGFKGRDAVLRWSMYSARSGRRVSLSTLHDVPANDVDLQAPTDRFVVQVWVPPLHKAAKLFVRVDLVRGGTILAVADSPAFVESRR